MTDEVLRLVERCEQATGLDTLELINLHCDICHAVGIESDDQQHAFPVSLDGALTLVPAGLGWLAGYGRCKADEKLGAAMIAPSAPHPFDPRCGADCGCRSRNPCPRALRSRIESPRLKHNRAQQVRR